MNIRKITSMTMLLSLVVLILNSVILYVVPEGRVAYWADWKFFGLTKGDWSAQHTTVGFLFLFAGLLHIYFNWKPILAYMKNKARQVKVFTGSFNVALALTVIFIVGTYYNVPPMSTIVEISEHFKDEAAKTYGEPPYGHAESSSLKMFTKRESLDLAKSMELLEAADIAVSGEKESIKDIADNASKSPQQIFEIIKKINTENNTTIFLVEQNANLALKVAHRGYVMENGRITLSDSAENLFANEAVKTAYLGI